jgi:hypothetical protein
VKNASWAGSAIFYVTALSWRLHHACVSELGKIRCISIPRVPDHREGVVLNFESLDTQNALRSIAKERDVNLSRVNV